MHKLHNIDLSGISHVRFQIFFLCGEALSALQTLSKHYAWVICKTLFCFSHLKEYFKVLKPITRRNQGPFKRKKLYSQTNSEFYLVKSSETFQLTTTTITKSFHISKSWQIGRQILLFSSKNDFLVIFSYISNFHILEVILVVNF